MKLYLLVLLNITAVLAFSQSGDTVFTVKAPKSGITIAPATDFLYKDLTKKFRILKSATAKIDTIMFSEGKVQYNDSFLYIKPSKSKTAILKIYEKGAGGKRVLAYVKEFEVRKFVEPKPNVDGVNADSAIHRMKIVAQGYVNVPYTTDEALKRMSYKVISFDMLVSKSGGFDTLKANGNRMTYEMRDKVDYMPDGSVIELNNIKYIMADDTMTVKQPLRIYLINDPGNKF